MVKGKKPKVAKLDHGDGVNPGNDDLTESVNEGQDDVGGLVSPPTKDYGKQKSIESSIPTEEVIPENIDVEQLNSSQPSSSKQTLEQQVEFLVQSVQSFQASAGDYKTLYLESQKMVEALTKDNQQLAIKLESALAKVEVYDKMREAFASLKDLVVVSKLTKGTDVLVEFTSQVTSGQGTTPAVAAEPPLNSSLPQTTSDKGTTPAVAAEPGACLPQATSGQGTTPAVAAEPGACLPQATSGQGTTPAVTAEPGASLPQATSGQGTASTVNAEPEASLPEASELRRSKRGRKKKVLED